MAKSAGGRGNDGVTDNGLEIGELALATVLDQLTLLEIHDPGGIIATVFKSSESLEKNRDHSTRSGISYNATHI
jgi:hypothetical protein